MLVSGRNNVKEVLRNFCEIDSVRKAYCQENFNEFDILYVNNCLFIISIYQL